MHDPQGTLLCVHTVSALKLLNVHLAVIHAQHDYALHTMDDIRAFNTLVMAPDWAKISDRMRAIVALDGFLSDAERAQVCARFPHARIIEVTDMGRHAAETAGRLLPVTTRCARFTGCSDRGSRCPIHSSSCPRNRA